MKKRKGTTLVEVLVAIAVFAVASLGMFSSVLGMRTIVTRQEEMVRVEMICQDIAYYHDGYGDSWATAYFGEGVAADTGYFNKDFKPQSSEEGAKYRLSYHGYELENGKQSLSISITELSGRVVLEEFNYGGRWNG